ncbi:hypothetical protein BH24DEI2_BH24DEI2_17480 [soil metagenome]
MSGKPRIALTQSPGKLAGLEAGLLERGFEVVRSPLIKTEPILTEAVRERAEALLHCPWLLFTSPNGVETWGKLGVGFGQAQLGAVGAKTAAALKGLGGTVALVGEPQTSLGLAETFLQTVRAKAPVGLPRGDRALPTLQDELEKNGLETRPLVVYRTVLNAFNADDIDVNEVDIVVLSSPSAVEALPRTVGARANLVALGPSTGAAIAEYGWRYVQAERPDVDAVLDALEKSTP